MSHFTTERSEAPPSKGLVLLADDDELFREGFSRLLRRSGYECLVAGDAEEAVAVLHANEVDALISDIHMPGNAGLRMIQKLPEIRRGLPVILLTGRPELETAKQSIRLAVAGYLEKPPDLKELMLLLDQNIARYRELRAVTTSRERLKQWSKELEVLEEALRRPGADNKARGNFLRLSLHKMALQLSELAQSTAPAEPLQDAAEQLEKLQLVSALQQTIEVLESTRKSFKSKELAELRKRLSALLAEHGAGGEKPAAGP